MYIVQTLDSSPGLGSGSNSRLRRSLRNGDNWSPFNPIIFLRKNNEGRDGVVVGGFELYYDNGAESGLRPPSTSMSEF